ncbi:MAG TPA: glycosyltransferase family 4 protein [Terriglobales bacterium]|nr:glycosyltransferase family 4 protein [Terriglobales bacterium]
MANPLRIAHADFSPVWRGGQQQLLLLAQGLRALGCEQWIVAPPGVVMQRLQAAGFAVAPPGLRSFGWARAADVVHAHDGHAHGWMLQATWRHRTLRVLSRRVAFPIRGWGSRWKYRRLDLALAVSACVRRQVEATGLAPGRIRVIPDAVDLAALPAPANARQRIRLRLGLDQSTPCLVCLGAFTPEKGIADLIAALPRLPPACRLLLPGEGPLRATLQRQVQALQLGARVHFVGVAEFSAAEWVAAADLFAMPSLQEGLGSAALLAMALRRPIVASSAGGIPELVADGATGLLVPAGDAIALAAACQRLLDHPALALRLVDQAESRVRQHHGAEPVAAATLAAYRAVPPPRRRRQE